MLDIREVADELTPNVLNDGETVEYAYEVDGGAVVFTNLRLIAFVRHGENVRYQSVPYANVDRVRATRRKVVVYTDQGRLVYRTADPEVGQTAGRMAL